MNAKKILYFCCGKCCGKKIFFSCICIIEKFLKKFDCKLSQVYNSFSSRCGKICFYSKNSANLTMPFKIFFSPCVLLYTKCNSSSVSKRRSFASYEKNFFQVFFSANAVALGVGIYGLEILICSDKIIVVELG